MQLGLYINIILYYIILYYIVTHHNTVFTLSACAPALGAAGCPGDYQIILTNSN